MQTWFYIRDKTAKLKILYTGCFKIDARAFVLFCSVANFYLLTPQQRKHELRYFLDSEQVRRKRSLLDTSRKRNLKDLDLVILEAILWVYLFRSTAQENFHLENFSLVFHNVLVRHHVGYQQFNLTAKGIISGNGSGK